MQTDFRSRVELLRGDYRRQTGREFSHFFCPILRVDEPVELCRGHIIPDATGESNTWVPQRKDVDSFYGHAVEAAFVELIQDRGRSIGEVWTEPTLRRRYRPRLEVNGRAIDHYFPTQNQSIPGQTPVTIVDGQGATICCMMVKESSDQLLAIDGTELQLVVERDFVAPVIASVLKAAHLTLFYILGYSYALSPSGIYLADILKEFYVRHKKTPPKQLSDALSEYFETFDGMVLPILRIENSGFDGSLVDNQLIACVGGSGAFFALGVIIKAKTESFCVFLPTPDGYTIDTYLSFMKIPPPSIAVKAVRFVPETEHTEAHWETSPGVPRRISLPHESHDLAPDLCGDYFGPGNPES